MLIIKHKQLFLPHWDKKLDGIKIAILSDFHIYYGKTDIKKLEKIVELTNSQKPDLIFLLGDFESRTIGQSKERQTEAANILQKLSAKYGVIAILGNHDYAPPHVINNMLTEANIPLLENQSKYVTFNNRKLRIIGFKDLWHARLYPDEIIGKTQNNTPVIVLSHNPDIFPAIPDTVSLTLNGHNHGGEIYLPVIGAPFIPSEYHQKYRKGYIIENGKQLFVTSGLGTLSGFRFLNPPEIVILTLYSQTPEHKITDTKPLTGIEKNYIPYYQKAVRKLKHILPGRQKNTAF